MKFGKTLDYSMMLTAPVRESLHWKSYKMPRPDQPDGLRRMPGPGRVHQGPGQEVLHQPGGILEGSTVPEDRRAVWEPDVTFLPRCKCSGGGGLVKIEMAGAGADIANILGRRERYGGCALSLDLGLAARIVDSADSLGTRLSSTLPTDDRCSSSDMLVKMKI